MIVAESLVEVQPAIQIPAFTANEAWTDLDTMIEHGDFWEMLLPSEFTEPTARTGCARGGARCAPQRRSVASFAQN